MLVADPKVDRIIYKIYNKEVDLQNDLLSRKVDDLFDIIKSRVREKGLSYTSNSLHSELFDLRVEVYKHLTADLFESLLLNEIGNRYFNSSKYPRLATLYTDALELHYNIIKSQIDAALDSTNGGAMPMIVPDELPTLNSLKYLFHKIPDRKMGKALVDLVENSLDLEFAMMICNVLLDSEKGETPIAIEKDARLFLKSSIESFAMAAISANIWHLPENNHDETYLIRNIKIKLAAAQLEKGNGKAYSDDQLFSLLSI